MLPLRRRRLRLLLLLLLLLLFFFVGGGASRRLRGFERRLPRRQLRLATNRERATGAWMRLREERIKDVAQEESKKAA
jgi:hypothetical protein